MTPLWTADALRDATGGTMRVPFGATGISIDTRTLRPGDLFVALVGNTDGHAHVAEALRRGAAGAMVHFTEGMAQDAPLLVVHDTLAGLHALGRAGRARFTGTMIAVTGSVGKTTLKEMLRIVLSACGPTHAAEASYNNHWGVPLTLARLPSDATYCIAEIGMNHAGEVLPLAQLAAPHVAIVTTIASAHIGNLGSLEAIADEKAMILRGLAPGGTAILPADSPFLARMAAQASGPVRTFGAAGDAALAGNRATIMGQSVTVQLQAAGAHMAMNATSALLACAVLGIDLVRAASALTEFVPGAGRGMQRRIGDIRLLDESYNASAASVRAALAVLAPMAGRRVAVLGDMLELGTHGPAEHADLAHDVTRASDLLYACGPLMRHLYDSVPPNHRGAHTADSAALAPVVAAAVRPGDAVLVKGSLGSRMRLVVNALDHLGEHGR